MAENTFVNSISTAYFPNIYYIISLTKHAAVYINDVEIFQKQTQRNRCFIMGPNGLLRLSVPLEKYVKMNTSTRDIRVDQNCNWYRIHIKSFEAAYNNAPFFLYYKDEIFKILLKKHKYLIDLNLDILSYILKQLKFKVEIGLLSELDNFSKIDAVNVLNLLEPSANTIQYPSYYQVFSDKHSFVSNLSIIDLLANEGPNSGSYTKSIGVEKHS